MGPDECGRHYAATHVGAAAVRAGPMRWRLRRRCLQAAGPQFDRSHVIMAPPADTGL
jgi:hypothetical protein